MESFIQETYRTALLYNVNPIIFAVIYFGTFIPCWYGVYKIGVSIKNRDPERLLIWIIIEGILLLLPFLYVAVFGKNLPLWFWVVLIFIIIATLVEGLNRVVKKLSAEDRSRLLWSLHAPLYNLKVNSTVHRDLQKRVINCLSLKNGDVILDAGAGTGPLELALESMGVTHFKLIGIDFSKPMIRKARRRFIGLNNYKFQVASLEKKLPFQNNFFDKIATINTLNLITPPEKSIKEFYRVLKEKGVLVISVPKSTFSGKAIAIAYFQHLDSKNIFKKATSFLKLCLIQLLISPFEYVISSKEKKRDYNLFRDGDIEKILKKSGFTVVSTQDAFAGQNYLIKAMK